MSLLLSDKVWVMISEVAKRGIYPTHGSKIGIFRLPADIVGQKEINNLMNELKSSGFILDTYADRIFVTYKWSEKGFDIYTNTEQTANLEMTVEIVTGEVIDLIYQIKPLEQFGDYYWVKNYRQKADHYAKIIIDTIIRSTKISQKLQNHYQKIQKLSKEDAIKKLEEITPLANGIKKLKETDKQVQKPQIPGTPSSTSNIIQQKENLVSTPNTTDEKVPFITQTNPEIAVAAPSVSESSGDTTISLTGSGTDYSAVDGPIDTGFKAKRKPVGKFKGIEVWGPYDPPGQLGIWGTDVCVDFDICISDGACIDACPVNVYEWLDTPGHPASERKPFMAREKDCIFCLACENVCPPQAIKIFKK